VPCSSEIAEAVEAATRRAREQQEIIERLRDERQQILAGRHKQHSRPKPSRPPDASGLKTNAQTGSVSVAALHPWSEDRRQAKGSLYFAVEQQLVSSMRCALSHVCQPVAHAAAVLLSAQPVLAAAR
jgi:hypothetical protein